MAKLKNKDEIINAYNQVRLDSDETNWCCLKYDNEDLISLKGSGESFDDLVAQLADDERAFIYLRVQTGDEMSKRMKFALISWNGPSVGALKKAKMSTAKAVVKQVWSAFAIEKHIEELKELKEEEIKDELIRAGGANYGTGQ